SMVSCRSIIPQSHAKALGVAAQERAINCPQPAATAVFQRCAHAAAVAARSVYRAGRACLSVCRWTIYRRGQGPIGHKENYLVASSKLGWRKRAYAVANYLWLRICAGLAARRRRKVAAILYRELSKLSDAELGRRGLAREDLHRLTSEISES